MEVTYIVAAVNVAKAIRLYTARPSQKGACERELAQQRLQVLLWAEANSEEDAMGKAMQLTALQMMDRG